jgi:hypothetical protein
LKKISGLDKLIEKNGFDGKGNFINYGEDIITLTLNEDTNLSAGSLIMLYKTLSWSKNSGKKMIPENLLRFDLEITVSETRHYNRVMGENMIADVPNKYTYYLYECQFIFDKISHGDSIDMSSIKILEDGVNISFTYKYSTMKMSTYLPSDSINIEEGNKYNSMYFSENSIDNSKLNVYGGIIPLGASANPSMIASGSFTKTYGNRNIVGKIGNFGNLLDGISQPLNSINNKLPSNMDISNFNLNRVRSTVSATIIQPNINSKMMDDIYNLYNQGNNNEVRIIQPKITSDMMDNIKEIYENTKTNIISNLNSRVYANDSIDKTQNSNSNVYSSLYAEADIYNTDNFGNYISMNYINNNITQNKFGQNINILVNSSTGTNIYNENVFILPNIDPIIEFTSPNFSAFINLGDDNVYYDRFGLSLNGGFSIGGFSIGGNLTLDSNGIELNGGLSF